MSGSAIFLSGLKISLSICLFMNCCHLSNWQGICQCIMTHTVTIGCSCMMCFMCEQSVINQVLDYAYFVG